MFFIAFLLLALLLLLTHCGVKLYRHRSFINGLRKQGYPVPKGWNFLTGHILTVIQLTRRFPSDANINLTMKLLATQFPDDEMYIIDMWPIAPPMFTILNPEAATQVTQKLNLPKNRFAGEMVAPITGPKMLLNMNGEEWKKWRSLFNPGFSMASLTEQIPAVVDSVEIFCEKLKKHAKKGDIVELDEMVIRLTFDVIMKISLDMDINYQQTPHILGHAFDKILTWHSFWDPLVLLNPLRPLIQTHYSHRINQEVGKELEKRFAELKHEAANPTSTVVKKQKSVIGLALQSYIQDQLKNSKPGNFCEKGNTGAVLDSAKLDPSFTSIVTNQLRLFLFAGNDSTSSTLIFILHLLQKHTPILSKMRSEHSSVFGPNPSSASSLLRSSPHLLSSLPYTLAVIKETLRLYPPADGMRQGLPGVSVTGPNGRVYATEGLAMVMLHLGIQTNPRIWVRANEFLPERWLVEPGHELYCGIPGSWRPFEHGPRACIGQALSLVEIRVVLVLVGRVFDFRPSYEEWEEEEREKGGCFGRVRRWVVGEGKREVGGERCYQTDRAGAHPSCGYPCKVSVR